VGCDNWELRTRSLSRIKKPSSFSYVRAKPLNLKRKRSAGTIMAKAIQRTRTMVLTSPSETYRYRVKKPGKTGKISDRYDDED